MHAEVGRARREVPRTGTERVSLQRQNPSHCRRQSDQRDQAARIGRPWVRPRFAATRYPLRLFRRVRLHLEDWEWLQDNPAACSQRRRIWLFLPLAVHLVWRLLPAAAQCLPLWLWLDRWLSSFDFARTEVPPSGSELLYVPALPKINSQRLAQTPSSANDSRDHLSRLESTFDQA